jgi:hypothetical protein
MGSIVRMERNERFINAFNELACEKYSFREFPCFKQQSLGDDCEMVRMFVMIENRGREEELMLPIIFFDPEEGFDWDIINRVCEVFDLEETEAKQMLRQAELID